MAASPPVSDRIAGELRDQIMTGALAPGARLSSGPELREQYGVSNTTVARVTQMLRSWGLVETRVGSGTFVVEAPPAVGPGDHSDRVQQGRPIYAPGENTRVYEASVITTEVVSADVVSAVGLPVPSHEIVGESTTIIKRARVMSDAAGAVTGVCCTWFNHPLIAQQGRRGTEVIERLTSPERIAGGTAHLLTDLFGHDLTHTTTRVGQRHLPVSVARQLGKDPGLPVLWLLQTRHADEYVIEVDEWFRLSDVVL